MSTAMEAAAQALFEATTPQATAGMPRPQLVIFETAAKAVILAIREPTPEMVEAADGATTASQVWQRMVDEVLK